MSLTQLLLVNKNLLKMLLVNSEAEKKSSYSDSWRKCKNILSLFSPWLLFHAIHVFGLCFRFPNDDWSFFSERIITSGGFHKQGHKKRNGSSGNCLISIWTVFDLHDISASLTLFECQRNVKRIFENIFKI